MAPATPKLVSVILWVISLLAHKAISGSDGTQIPASVYRNNTSSALVGRRGKCRSIYEGKWVFDKSYPLYEALQCPYIDHNGNCRGNGRPDSAYEKWRWAPLRCAIPKFNGMKMLNKLRGKRLMFVGDSISRSQWESLVCLVQGSIPPERKTLVSTYPLLQFKALDYDASIEFFWSPLLVELDTDNNNKKILKLDTIGDQGSTWKAADILIFESSHWWTHTDSQKSWDIITYGNQKYPGMAPMNAYRRALITWSNWVSSNLNPQKTQVYFRTTSPKHSRCFAETGPAVAWKVPPPVPEESRVLKQVLQETKFPVRVLDITALSEYRKDAHPTIYGGTLNGQQKRNPDQFADCSHWCLPGVPDTWNQLLFVSLFHKNIA